MSPLLKSSKEDVVVNRPADNGSRSKLAQEEAAIEAKIVEVITSGKWDSLQPNTGKSVEVRGSHLCIDYREDVATGYRTWEWHGHCMVYVEGDGYVPEYIYGNYFEPLVGGLTAAAAARGFSGLTLGRTGGMMSRMGGPLGLGEIMNGGLGLRRK